MAAIHIATRTSTMNALSLLFAAPRPRPKVVWED